jgi:hypothetical protein
LTSAKERRDPKGEGLGTLIARFLAERKTESHDYGPTSKRAGLDDQWIEKTIKRNPSTAKRGSLLKIAAALDLTQEERVELELVTGLAKNSLKATEAREVCEPRISMRRAIILLTAPTDPHLSPLRVKIPGVAIRTGVVFGWHDVVTRVTTPEGVSVLDYADRLFNGGKLRTIETIPLRDDLPIFIDSEFDEKGLGDGDDYYWAVIFVQALGTPKKPEFREIFRKVAQRGDFKGGIHLLTAGVAIGQFDTVVEVLAGSFRRLQEYVRESQMHANDEGRDVHTVTYFAPRWQFADGGLF